MIAIKIVEAVKCLPELIEQTTSQNEPILLATEGEGRAVLLSLKAFEALIGVRQYSDRAPIPLEKLQQEFKQALAIAGYETKEQIVELVQDIKREMADERYTHLPDSDSI